MLHLYISIKHLLKANNTDKIVFIDLIGFAGASKNHHVVLHEILYRIFSGN